MRTYDPADRILYVRMGSPDVAPAPAPPAQDECHRLPDGYANASVPVRPAGARPALVLLQGGAAPADARGRARGLRLATR